VSAGQFQRLQPAPWRKHGQRRRIQTNNRFSNKQARRRHRGEQGLYSGADPKALTSVEWQNDRLNRRLWARSGLKFYCSVPHQSIFTALHRIGFYVVPAIGRWICTGWRVNPTKLRVNCNNTQYKIKVLRKPHGPTARRWSPFLQPSIRHQLIQPKSSFYRPRRDGRLSWPSWLISYRDGLPAWRRSPIHVLTKPDVD